MIKFFLLLLLPAIAFGFSETNLPALIVAESVQPMDGHNLNATLDNQMLVITNGHCALHVTFNSEPTQLPRGCFRFSGSRVDTTVEPVSSTYPTNSNLDGYFSYVFYCPAPELPEGTRLWFRKQIYFGGPPDSGRGLDCSGIAFFDVASGLIWLPQTNCTRRLLDGDGNIVVDTFKGGFNVTPPAMMLMSAPEE